MKVANKQLARSAQSWMERVKKMSKIHVIYDSEPRDWLRQIIQEAEKDRESKKKDKFPSLPDSS